MTIQQLRDVYINNRSTYCSADTILKYTDDLDLFFRFLESHYRVDPAVSSFDSLTGSVSAGSDILPTWLLDTINKESWCLVNFRGQKKNRPRSS